MNKLFVLFLLFSLLQESVFATIIEGHNSEYAGEKLDFYQFADPVTKQKEFVFSLEFDGQGNCKTTIPVSKTTSVFCDFGIYKGMLFLEPDKSIKLLLPPFREKSFADQKNPFFEPVSFWFNTENENDLNNKISAFDSKFNQLTDQYFNQLYFRQSKEIYDSIITILNHSFPVNSMEVLAIHKKLKLKLLETDVFRLKAENVSEIFSEINSDFWDHPAYIEFFEKKFDKKLSFDAKEVKGLEIRKAVAEANFSFLSDHIKTKYKLKGESTELALLKMLHDGFYSGEFSKNSILYLLDSDNLTNHSNLKIRKIAINVSNKLKYLLPRSAAPVICLKNIDGYKKCSDESVEKFKYIVFADNEMIVCREHLKYLTKIEQQFQKNLEIILIMRKTDLIEMKLFLIENEIPGIKLVDKNGVFIEKYKVKSFPACFLLDKNHKVKFAETKAPLDGFEQQFGAFLRNELFEQQRNQSR